MTGGQTVRTSSRRRGRGVEDPGVTTPALTAVPGVNAPQPTTYAEFWPYYVSQHLHPATRALHAWGPLLALTIAVVGIGTGRLALLPAALVVGYGIAWFSHFAIERNRPASWGRPAWSFRGDMQLIGRYFSGALAQDVAEVRRVLGMRADQVVLADVA